jgi:pseudouridine kinase
MLLAGSPGEEHVDKRGYVAVVGGINMDIQGRAGGVFVLGDSNPGRSFMSPGGVGRNVAENLVRLGLSTELVTVMGDDTLSAELAKSCGRQGIGIRGALRLSSTPASQYICLLDGGEETRGRLIGAVAAMEAFDRLTPERLMERAGLLDAASLVFVDANLPAESIAWLAERYGRGRPSPVLGGTKPRLAFDPVSTAKARKAVDVIGAFDFAKPNRAEVEVLSGVHVASKADLPKAVAVLRDKGLGDVFVSLGAEGLYYEGIGPNGALQRGIVIPPALPVVNVSGAGDAAGAALAWGLLSDLELSQRAAFAVCAAALTTTSPETVCQELCAARLVELAKGVSHEQVS